MLPKARFYLNCLTGWKGDILFQNARKVMLCIFIQYNADQAMLIELLWPRDLWGQAK